MELVTMSSSELDRVAIFQKIAERRLTHAKAGELLGLSARQTRRLYGVYKAQGPSVSEKVTRREKERILAERALRPPMPELTAHQRTAAMTLLACVNQLEATAKEKQRRQNAAARKRRQSESLRRIGTGPGGLRR